jgi:hypothetical protein
MSSTFLEPGVLASPGKYAALFDGLPADPAGVAAVVHGLLIHEFWAGAYGVTLAEADRDRVNLRRVARIATNCRGFTVMAVAMLRSKGVPARARCGFGAYFAPDFFEDHWVAEFFDGSRWRLLDAQIDGLQREKLTIDFDLTDVPHDRFVIAGDAWRQFRAGRVDPAKFGLSVIGEAGDWWIAANLMRDAAALLGVEVLPWDDWGPMPGPDDRVDVALFDELAAATSEPSIDHLRRVMRVPEQVFNVQHRRLETI